MSGRKQIQSALAAFTIDDLLSEVVRRRNELQAKDADEIVLCDECIHVRYWTKDSEPPNDFNICGKGHRLSFRIAEEWEGPHGPTGFYRRVCADRVGRAKS